MGNRWNCGSPWKQSRGDPSPAHQKGLQWRQDHRLKDTVKAGVRVKLTTGRWRCIFVTALPAPPPPRQPLHLWAAQPAALTCGQNSPNPSQTRVWETVRLVSWDLQSDIGREGNPWADSQLRAWETGSRTYLVILAHPGPRTLEWDLSEETETDREGGQQRSRPDSQTHPPSSSLDKWPNSAASKSPGSSCAQLSMSYNSGSDETFWYKTGQDDMRGSLRNQERIYRMWRRARRQSNCFRMPIM